MSQVLVYPTAYWAHRAAAYIVDILQRTLAAHPERELAVALAGGTTPASVYRYWTLEAPVEFDWSRLHLFLADERIVPPDHADSNFRMAREQLPAALHWYPVETAHPAERAAREYEALIRATVWSEPPSFVPRFDLILLGVGEDGHTASLFPGSPVLKERRCLVSAAVHPESAQERVTFTLPLIQAAAHVAFLVTGAAKSPMLSRILSQTPDSTLPAALAAAEARAAVWLVDEAAHADARNR